MSYGERHQKCVRFVVPHIFEIFHLKEKKKIGKKIKNRKRNYTSNTVWSLFHWKQKTLTIRKVKKKQ